MDWQELTGGTVGSHSSSTVPMHSLSSFPVLQTSKTFKTAAGKVSGWVGYRIHMHEALGSLHMPEWCSGSLSLKNKIFKSKMKGPGGGALG